MPEGVEVRIQTEGLQEGIIGDSIERIVFGDKGEKLIRPITVERFEERVVGETFKEVSRKGKYITFKLGDSFMTSHLAMTGSWLLDVPEGVGKTRITFYLSSGRVLRYCDTRLFGRIRLEETLDNPIYHRGIDVLNATVEEISQEIKRIKERKATLLIKRLLTDQKFLSGLGNVYANEVLWDMHLYPGKPISDLDDQQIELLAFTIKNVLSHGYAEGGLSFKDYYHLDGSRGKAQESLEVYKQKECSSCGGELGRTERFDKRTTYYCPVCQL